MVSGDCRIFPAHPASSQNHDASIVTKAILERRLILDAQEMP
jgi:hypothetical protein